MTYNFGHRWLNFDVHGRVGIRVAADAPTARQLRTMLACFVTDHDVPPDIVVTADMDHLPEAAVLEDQLVYTDHAVRFPRSRVQIELDRESVRIQGAGELLTTMLPLLDWAMIQRGAAMIHAATVSYHGHAVVLPAAGGTGKTSTVAKLVRREGFSFMGDDWAFAAEDSTLLGFEKPMFIKPHHRAIYPHLFEGARKPLVPVSMSRAVGRATTLVHPYVIRYPRLADFSRRWSPEHRIVTAEDALPGVRITASAPLLAAVFVERYEGARTRLEARDTSWMVDRMVGNFHLEMPGFSRDVLTALAGTSLLSATQYFDERATILTKPMDDLPCFLLRVPSVYPPDIASDDIVAEIEGLLTSLRHAKKNQNGEGID